LNITKESFILSLFYSTASNPVVASDPGLLVLQQGFSWPFCFSFPFWKF